MAIIFEILSWFFLMFVFLNSPFLLSWTRCIFVSLCVRDIVPWTLEHKWGARSNTIGLVLDVVLCLHHVLGNFGTSLLSCLQMMIQLRLNVFIFFACCCSCKLRNVWQALKTTLFSDVLCWFGVSLFTLAAILSAVGHTNSPKRCDDRGGQSGFHFRLGSGRRSRHRACNQVRACSGHN